MALHNLLRTVTGIVADEYLVVRSRLVRERAAWMVQSVTLDQDFSSENLQAYFLRHYTRSVSDDDIDKWESLFANIMDAPERTRDTKLRIFSCMFIFCGIPAPTDSDLTFEIIRLCLKWRREELYLMERGHPDVITGTRCPAPGHLYAAMRYAFPSATSDFAVTRLKYLSSLASQAGKGCIWSGSITNMQELETKASECLACDVVFGAKYLLNKLEKCMPEEFRVNLEHLVSVIVEAYFLKYPFGSPVLKENGFE